MVLPSKAIRVYSARILESARSLGFALMKANYVARSAPEFPDGLIHGVAPEARDIACNLRDSISARFDSLRFHYELMLRVRQGHLRQLQQAEAGSARAQMLWLASMETHYLFDDIVFNAASLFDYIGNAVWFGFHGQNHIKKKWNKAYEAAKRVELETKLPNGPRLFGSTTGDLIKEAHEAFVNRLYEYRSDLIHHRIDGPEVYSHQFWADISHTDLRLPVPRTYMRRLRRLVGDAALDENSVDIIAGAEELINKVGECSVRLIESLRDEFGWVEGEPLTMVD